MPRSPGPGPARAQARRGAPGAPSASALTQLPYVIVLGCVVAGIVLAWRGAHAVGTGAEVVGGALLAGGIVRLLLPRNQAGLLASRRRFADVLALGTLGAGLLALALVLPPT